MDPALRRALAIAVGLAAMLAAPGARAQFSPGDLASPHHKLEGISNCTKCHAEGKQLSPSLCLECHSDVKKRINAKAGYHGRLPSGERDQCESCHKEHKGESHKLIDWGRGGMTSFDHSRTGFALRGKHAKEKCQSCHDQKHIVDAGVLQTLAKEPKKETWLGVGKACTSCHFDEHRGQEGKDCERCHTEQGWKPVPKFSHDKTSFVLAGKHKGVQCKECHKDEKDGASHPAFPAPLQSAFSRFAPLDHKRCTDCHEDPHHGKFNKNCESCHTVEGWTTLKKSTDRDFHEKTAFPLKGAHKDVACTMCHGPWPGKPAKFRGLPYKQCTDCHADAHDKQLKGACDTCHDVEHWTPSRFELEDHQKTAYPLDGAHAAVACTSCHFTGTPTTKVVAPAAVAASRDKHGKHDRHDRHRKPSKADKAKGGARAQSTLVLASSAWIFHPRGDMQRCESCHKDEHAGQLAHFDDGCRHCHSTKTFEAVSFNHTESRFALTGKHAGAPCASCHKEMTISGQKTVRYRPIESACTSCHKDEHLGQFKDKTCETCHTTERFSPSLFSHDNPALTRYRLDGRHQKVPCASCHKPITVAGQKVTRYRPLPTACEACHEDFHHGDFRGFQP